MITVPTKLQSRKGIIASKDLEFVVFWFSYKTQQNGLTDVVMYGSDVWHKLPVAERLETIFLIVLYIFWNQGAAIAQLRKATVNVKQWLWLSICSM